MAQTRHVAWTWQRVLAEWRLGSLLVVAPVVILLFAGALSVAVGTILGLTNFRDVGYPDSAILLRVGDTFHSGHIYPAIDRPPYLVTVYGPLTYVLLGIPYALAQAAGVNPEVPVRLAVVGALCICALFIFLISRRLYSSRPIAWLCVLFAVSVTPFAKWTTQIRGDLPAVGFSFMSIYIFLRGNRRLQLTGAAICAGIAVLVKQTFLAAPVAITCWLIYRRRYKDAALFATGFVLIVAGGYAFALWREPLMLKHMAAIRHPILEYGGVLGILWRALSQPVVPFAALGGFLVLWRWDAERLLFLIYCLVAWLVAIVTILQVGGNTNYFWEPLLASAVLAGPGLYELQRKAKRTPVLVAAMFCVLFLGLYWPRLRQDVDYLRLSYRNAVNYQARKAKWESFVATVSGRRLLSTFPDVSVLASTPELPDPFLNSMLELRDMWSSGPVVAQIDAGAYDLIIISTGEADSSKANYRGIRVWSDRMWSAVKRTYRPACGFDGMEVWVPLQGADDIVPNLLAIGCLPVAKANPELGSQLQWTQGLTRLSEADPVPPKLLLSKNSHLE